MTLVLLDVVLGVLALAVLGLVAYSLYKRVRALTRAFGASSARLAEASVDLNAQHSTAATRR